MITDKDLKSCPFCGGLAIVVRGMQDSWVGCACGAKGPARSSDEEAKEAWNRRDDQALKPALKLLNAMGVSEDRIGKDVCRGIDVLSTRYRKELEAVAYNSADQARKEAAERAIKCLCEFEDEWIVIDGKICSAHEQRMRYAILNPTVKEGKTDAEKLAIAVKALEEIVILGTHKTLPGRSLNGERRESETITNQYAVRAEIALKEIQGC